jgi:CheY-like chemotaxis protein
MAEVLIVDDDEDTRRAIRWVLDDEGHTVTEAADGQPALRILRTSPHRLVALVDHRMPGMSGLALLRLLCLDDATARRHACFLVTASPASVAADVRALAPLMDVALIAKPFQLDDLLAAVARAAQRLEARHHPA